MDQLTTSQRLVLVELIATLDAEVAAMDLAVATILQQRRKDVVGSRKRKAKKRLFWTRQWLLDRPMMSQYRLITDTLQFQDVQAFKTAVRMEPEMFFAILNRIQDRIVKQDTFWRMAIDPGTRFAVTLKFYSAGEPYKSMSLAWYIPHNTLSKIVKEVSEAIIAEFGEKLLCPPLTPDKWKEVADRFSNRWNFHNCLGAIDGKHVAIKMPNKSGSMYYNYKGFYSIIMMAIVDGDYKFLYVDAGSTGSASDAQIWNSCEIKELVEADKLGFPEAEDFPDGDRLIPYFFVGDDAFALRTFLMKPYGKRNLTRKERIFNYRLSRARRIVENAFGILANKFGCLLTTLRQKPDTVTSIVLACCCLHNILRDADPTYVSKVDREEDEDHALVEGDWRNGGELMDGERDQARNTSTKEAKDQRDYLKNYYNSNIGAVPWQDKHI